MRPLAVLALLLTASIVHADPFDDYHNPHLRKLAASSDHALKVTSLSFDDLVKYDEVLPRVKGAFVIVHTNDNRWAKMLVHASGQKIDMDRSANMAHIERFVTFKDGAEQAVAVKGADARLFNDFRFSADLGTIVPEKDFVADLRFVDKDGKRYIEPLGKAELFVVTKHLETVTRPKDAPVVVGNGPFNPALFNGRYKLFDDGKRTGTLTLEVDAKRNVTGSLVSTATGEKYEVTGSVGPNPMYGIFFTVALPRTAQEFSGWMFTGNAQAITGYSVMERRQAGFYAVRE